MQYKYLETESAPNKWYARRDARMTDLKWESTYSEQQKLKASRMRGCLGLVYGHREIHVNYRKGFIAIKVDRPVVRDRKNLALLEADWEREGITSRGTAQAMIYRIPRA